MSRMDYWKGRKSTVTVLYSYVYDNRHQRVCINEAERLILMEKTNSDWWQVTCAFHLSQFCLWLAQVRLS